MRMLFCGSDELNISQPVLSKILEAKEEKYKPVGQTEEKIMYKVAFSTITDNSKDNFRVPFVVMGASKDAYEKAKLLIGKKSVRLVFDAFVERTNFGDKVNLRVSDLLDVK